MNKTTKEATVQRYHYDRHDQLEAHLAAFINAYNYARRLKTLKGLTPYEYICKCWTSQPERFKLNQLQQIPGLNTRRTRVRTKRFALSRDPLQYGGHNYQTEIRWLPSNLASVKACSARKTMR